MKLVIQRVSKASVTVNDVIVGAIQQGLVVLVGITHTDTLDDINWLCHKLINLRIFNDESGVMNCSVQQINGEMLIISQFTLMASTHKGNRPSYIDACKPPLAEEMYNKFLTQLSLNFVGNIATGVFGANMDVQLTNQGPVTIIIDSKQKV